jgi:hypothetical protein
MLCPHEESGVILFPSSVWQGAMLLGQQFTKVYRLHAGQKMLCSLSLFGRTGVLDIGRCVKQLPPLVSRYSFQLQRIENAPAPASVQRWLGVLQ